MLKRKVVVDPKASVVIVGKRNASNRSVIREVTVDGRPVKVLRRDVYDRATANASAVLRDLWVGR